MIARLQREGVDESSDDKFGDSDCLWGGSMGCRPAAASYQGRAVSFDFAEFGGVPRDAARAYNDLRYSTKSDF